MRDMVRLINELNEGGCLNMMYGSSELGTCLPTSIWWERPSRLDRADAG